jgi:hypothetical protein
MAGARTKRANRIANAYPLVGQLMAHGKECDGVWWSRRHDGDDDWFTLTTPISVNNRGDEPMPEVNFEVAEETLDRDSAFGTEYRYDAWPGGLIKTLTIRADDALAVRSLGMVLDALADYPSLDDERLSAREWEQNHPSDRECYGGDECECDFRTHMHVLQISGPDTDVSHYDHPGKGWWLCDACGADVEEWEEGRFDAADPRPEPSA